MKNPVLHTLNPNVIKKLHPKSLLLYAILGWLILSFFSPFKSKFDLTLEFYVFIALNIFSFLLGTILVRKKKSFKVTNRYKSFYLLRLFLIISIIGIVFKLYDRFLFRGLSLNLSILENREMSMLGGGNIFGIIGSLLSPLSFQTLYIYLKYDFKISLFLRLLILTLPFIQVIDALAVGSRSLIFIVLVFIFLLNFSLGKIKFNFKKGIKYSTLALCFLFSMQSLFIKRTKEFIDEARLKQTVLEDSGFNYTLDTNNDFHTYVLETEGLLGNILFTYAVTTKYLLHGIYELNYLIENFQSKHTFGGYTFSLYERLFKKVVGLSNTKKNYSIIMPRNGIFTTFLGPVFVDFFWFSFVFTLLFGIYSKSVYLKFIQNNDSAFLVYIYITVVIMFSPVFNFISGANGLYIFTSFLLIKPLSRLKLIYKHN